MSRRNDHESRDPKDGRLTHPETQIGYPSLLDLPDCRLAVGSRDIWF
jgi:hypothetical protein